MKRKPPQSVTLDEAHQVAPEPKPFDLLRERSNLLNEKEAAEMLGLAPGTLRVWRCREIGPTYHRVGVGRGTIRYSVEDLAAFTSRHVPSVQASKEKAHEVVQA